jgi:hypothetical protein
MKLSFLAGILKKFDFIKDYSALIVPIMLTIIAALLFLPTTLLQHSLALKIEKQSNAQMTAILSLSKDTPSEKQWVSQKGRVNIFVQDSNAIIRQAEQSSKRQLLSYDVFPEPRELSPQIFSQFGQRYRDALDEWEKTLKARDCPTSEELSKSLNKNVTGDPEAAINSGSPIDKLIIDALCSKVAKENKVYFNQTGITGYQFWQNYKYTDKDSAIEECWYAQTGYWIVEDCLQTVKILNQNSTSVLEAPVKRIVNIAFTNEQDSSASSAPAMNMPYLGQNRSGRPEYVTALDSGLTLPLTARVSNDRFDVVQFRFSVIVSAKSVPEFLEQLCGGKEHKFKGFYNEFAKEEDYRHNQITILKAGLNVVSPEDKDNRLYRYGQDGTVKLDLLCEYAFEKKGYDEIKPASVKKKLEGMIQRAAL